MRVFVIYLSKQTFSIKFKFKLRSTFNFCTRTTVAIHDDKNADAAVITIFFSFEKKKTAKYQKKIKWTSNDSKHERILLLHVKPF